VKRSFGSRRPLLKPRFTKKPPFEVYSPGRKDRRTNEAAAMLSARPTLDGLDAHGLACCFNLKSTTAEKLLEIERQRRASRD